MCAIAGILDLPVEWVIYNKMLSTMHHRGPDHFGVYQDEKACLLHARLSVIDPDGGNQPMQFSGESYTIVYNGELYNTGELRKELKSLGHSFQTHSDTEVLLHAYCQWKEKCVDKLNGIFAFAVWEKESGRLFLARDRMGVKPLFYKLHDDGLLFASEIKTILTYPTVKPQLDHEGVAEIFLLGPGRTPGCGVFRGIMEVKPGFCGYYTEGKIDLKPYWTLEDRAHTDNFQQTAEKVRFLVTDAIKRQMVSDVPIGTFLSGGLDSSIITAVCAEEMAKQGRKLPTFSVDYVDNEKYFTASKFQPNSDTYYINLIQQHLNTDHHWCVLSPEDLVDAMHDAVIARDLPGMADVDISLLAFCRKIKEHVTVALSGECADEIFGGYPWYRDPQVRAAEGFPWAQNTAQRLSLLQPEYANRMDESYIRSRYEDTYKFSNILPGTTAEEARMKQMVNLNQNWFMQTLLDRKDRMSMYSALEVRVPFCDHRIAEYLYGVPWEFKDWQGKEKGLLRSAMVGILPDEILWRKKSPYPKTHDPQYLTLVSRQLETLLQNENAPIWRLIKPEMARDILQNEHPWPWYGQLMRKPQTICYLLQVNFWLEHYKVELI